AIRADTAALTAGGETAIYSSLESAYERIGDGTESAFTSIVLMTDGESADHVEMAGRKRGTMIGKGSVIAYPMDTSLKKHGGGLDRISFQQLREPALLHQLPLDPQLHRQLMGHGPVRAARPVHPLHPVQERPG
ncbi:hypothetical protein PUR30_21870, partial [Streptomyces sp. JV190]|nr:hypothetical protein [Streptomyces sp. JV190]